MWVRGFKKWCAFASPEVKEVPIAPFINPYTTRDNKRTKINKTAGLLIAAIRESHSLLISHLV